MASPEDQLSRFTLTTEHLRLLQRAYVGWQDCETGAPEIDPKRPYGNSDVVSDMAEILGLKWKHEECENCECEMPAEVKNKCINLHRETALALQIVLLHLDLATPLRGTYHKQKRYDDRSWKRA